VFPLGVNFDGLGPQGPGSFRRNPIHMMIIDGGDAQAYAEIAALDNPEIAFLGGLFSKNLMRFNVDLVIMPLQAATQWDALAHVYYDGLMYNGYPASLVNSFGASKLEIAKADVKGITSRGVLLDVVRHRGGGDVPGGNIMPEELDEIAAQQGVEIRPGDIVCLRFGVWERFVTTRQMPHPSPGLSWRCAEWLHAKDVAAVAADNVGVEGPQEIEGCFLALHLLCLRDMGMMFGEMWNFAALAADCASDGVWEFQLVAPPLRITGAVGSPLNPLALK
jgi:kynurenine formamidase